MQDDQVSNQSHGSTEDFESSRSQSQKSDPDTVSYEHHKKLLGQRKSDQIKIRELEERLNSFESERKKIEEAKLAEQGEYKKLLEMERQKSLRFESEKNELNTRLVNSVKYQAFLDSLPGKIRSNDYLVHANIDEIIVDPESGLIDPDSVKMVADRFVTEHGHLIDVKKEAAKVPPYASRPMAQKTISESSALERRQILRSALSEIYKQ